MRRIDKPLHQAIQSYEATATTVQLIKDGRMAVPSWMTLAELEQNEKAHLELLVLACKAWRKAVEEKDAKDTK
jgi:hypothetical protein